MIYTGNLGAAAGTNLGGCKPFIPSSLKSLKEFERIFKHPLRCVSLLYIDIYIYILYILYTQFESLNILSSFFKISFFRFWPTLKKHRKLFKLSNYPKKGCFFVCKQLFLNGLASLKGFSNSFKLFKLGWILPVFEVNSAFFCNQNPFQTPPDCGSLHKIGECGRNR